MTTTRGLICQNTVICVNLSTQASTMFYCMSSLERNPGKIFVARGGTRYILGWGGAAHTLTLFKTKIADFPTLFKTEFRFLIPSLRHS